MSQITIEEKLREELELFESLEEIDESVYDKIVNSKNEPITPSAGKRIEIIFDEFNVAISGYLYKVVSQFNHDINLFVHIPHTNDAILSFFRYNTSYILHGDESKGGQELYIHLYPLLQYNMVSRIVVDDVVESSEDSRAQFKAELLKLIKDVRSYSLTRVPGSDGGLLYESDEELIKDLDDDVDKLIDKYL